MREYSEEQLKIINKVEGNILVSASAGSGKSTVIIERTRHMVEDMNINPKDILIITYTKESAFDLQKKLTEKGLEGIRACTIHSVAFAMCGKFIKNIENKVFPDYLKEKALFAKAKQMGNVTNFIWKDVMRVIEFQKCNLVGVNDKYVFNENEEIGEDELKQYYQAYEEAKGDYIDFADMVSMAIPFLEKNKRIRYKYVMVDEAQDCDPLTNKFAETISDRNNLCMFGDLKQSIYSFKGSSPQMFSSFKDRLPNVEVMHLSTNYRSKKNIVDKASDFIEITYKNEPTYKRANSLDKADGKIEIISKATEEEEAESIVNYIKEEVENGKKYKDFMVIYRNNKLSITLQAMLRDNNIPYICSKNGNMFDYKEISGVIVALLRLIVDVDDDVALSKLLNARYGSARFIKKNLVNDIMAESSDLDISVYNTMKQIRGIDGRSKTTINNILKEINDVRLKYDGDTFKIVNYIIRKYNMYQQMNDLYEEDGINSRRKAIEVLLNKSRIMSLEELIIYASGEGESKSGKTKSNNCVKLTTIHSSKGLESDVAIGIGIEDGVFPSDRGIYEEENNLFYVMATRARNVLKLYHRPKSTFIDMYSKGK